MTQIHDKVRKRMKKGKVNQLDVENKKDQHDYYKTR